MNDDIKLKDKKKFNLKTELIEWFKAIIVATIVGLFVTNYIIINAAIPTGSMEPTINKKDRIFANRLYYLYNEPEFGDIIVFPSPDDTDVLFIKRIIGEPLDEIIIYDGDLYINGEIIKESYLNEPMHGTFGPYTVPEDSYFVMGDNRNYSDDSRYWENTFVEESTIKGKAVFRYWGGFKVY